MRAKSPCVHYCVVRPDGLCPACGRTLDEIEHWTSMTDDERAKAVEDAKARVDNLKKLGEHVNYGEEQ